MKHKRDAFGRFKTNKGYCIDRGYKLVYTENDGCVLEHRLIMEKHLDRKLLSSELIHHKDGNKLNNKIDNIEITSQQEHPIIHFKGKARPCVTKFEIVDKLPNFHLGLIVSLKPDYRTYVCKKCVNCGMLFWTRKDKTAINCSNSCAITTAWRKGKYENRKIRICKNNT